MLTALQSAIAFLNPEILAMDAQKLDRPVHGRTDSVKTYRHMIEDALPRPEVTRWTPSARRCWRMLADAAQTPSNIFDMFESVDMTFPPVTGEDGKPETAFSRQLSPCIRESKNRAVRREAFEKYFGEYEKLHQYAITAMYAGSVKLRLLFLRRARLCQRLRGRAVRQQRARVSFTTHSSSRPSAADWTP